MVRCRVHLLISYGKIDDSLSKEKVLKIINQLKDKLHLEGFFVSCLNFLARKKYFTILKKTLQKLF